MQIRTATIDDAEAIRRIYNHEVATGTATFDLTPRSVQEQRIWLIERSGAHVVTVAQVDTEVVGYAAVGLLALVAEVRLPDDVGFPVG